MEHPVAVIIPPVCMSVRLACLKLPWEMLARAAASWCVGSAEAADLPCGGVLTLSDQAELLFLRRFFLIEVQLLVMLLPPPHRERR